MDRGRYLFQLEPYLERFERERIEIVSREELKRDRAATLRRVFAFLGVDADFTSQQFEREWETGTAKSSGRFRLMDRAVRLPGLRALDRNFDRLPERLRWAVERVVHDPDAGAVEKPELPSGLRAELVERYRPDVERLESWAGRSFGWLGRLNRRSSGDTGAMSQRDIEILRDVLRGVRARRRRGDAALHPPASSSSRSRRTSASSPTPIAVMTGCGATSTPSTR